MRGSRGRRHAFQIIGATIATLLLGSVFPIWADPPHDLSQYFGFRSLEIIKLQQRSGNLLAVDLTHDGLLDLVAVDNSNSRIDLLQQLQPVPSPDRSPLSVNGVPDTGRFQHHKISLDKAVAALSTGDFNGDGRTDLVYLGVPDRLIVRFQPEAGEWTERETFRLPDVQVSRGAIAAGDLNGDQRDDIIVLGKQSTYILYQGADGKFAPPVRLMNTSDKLSGAHIGDLDGDDRNDLCYLADEEGTKLLCFRQQGSDGRLGPEIRFELGRPRATTLRNIDGRPGLEILTIDSQTGRLRIQQIGAPRPAADGIPSRIVQFGFGQQGVGRDRDLATGDVNGDGLVDIVVTDPEAAQMIVFLQTPKLGLDLGTTFPGLVGTTQVRIGDLDGDGQAEVIVHSPREKIVGVSRMQDGRLTFPQPVPTDREPVAIELADLDEDGHPEIVYIGKERTGTETRYQLRALKLASAAANDFTWKPFVFPADEAGETAPKREGRQSFALTLRSDPERLASLDANRDGRPDFLIFQGLDRPPLFLRSDKSGDLIPVTGEGGITLGNVSPGAVFLGQLEEPAILVAQNNFARNLRLNERDQWQVVDQYNAAESAARIAGTAIIDLDGQPGNEIVLVDLGVNKLRILREQDGMYRPWKEVDIGSFPYKSAHVADLNGDGRNDLLLFGMGKLGVLSAGQNDLQLVELGTYESHLEKIHFADVIGGDLNQDGRVDVALIDTRSQFVEILDYTPEVGLRSALHFRVFESKGLAGADDIGSEPRESIIADVTGDGRADLILLAHDRVLVYPQDSGE